LKREILEKEKLEKEKQEKEIEKQERERLKNELNKIKKLLLILSNNGNIQETKIKIINENSNINLDKKVKEETYQNDDLIVTNWIVGNGCDYVYYKVDFHLH